MPIQMKTSGVHHVSLRVSDLNRAKKFYCDTLGFKHLMDADNLCLFLAGGTPFGLRGPTADMPKGDKFNPFRVGVDHIALACTDRSELKRVACRSRNREHRRQA
jgi:catechol 2,3-dioxygenase-like lactoylglutathione lyase family enzyme